jgi:hypothetical protein
MRNSAHALVASSQILHLVKGSRVQAHDQAVATARLLSESRVALNEAGAALERSRLDFGVAKPTASR